MTDDGLSDTQVIHQTELDEWVTRIHQLNDLSSDQRRVFQNFTESCVRLTQRRSEAHATALRFYEADRLNETTYDIQHDYYYRNEVFFHGFYSCLSQLASVVHRLPHVFAGVPCSSNRRFLEAMSSRYPKLGTHSETLESARNHRAFLDHPVSNRVSDWMTTSTSDKTRLKIIHFGMQGTGGGIPEGAELKSLKSIECDWHKVTPSYFDVEEAFKCLTDFVVAEIEQILTPQSKSGQQSV